jgi:hypothetical protein
MEKQDTAKKSPLISHIKDFYSPKELGINCPKDKEHDIDWTGNDLEYCRCNDCNNTFKHDKKLVGENSEGANLYKSGTEKRQKLINDIIDALEKEDYVDTLQHNISILGSAKIINILTDFVKKYYEKNKSKYDFAGMPNAVAEHLAETLYTSLFLTNLQNRLNEKTAINEEQQRMQFLAGILTEGKKS